MRKTFRVSEQMRSRDVLEAANEYLKCGLKLVLLYGIDGDGQCTCRDEECQSPGKHPIGTLFPNGVKSATDDAKRVRSAIRANPGCNIAIALHGLTIVDIDTDAGREAVKQLALPDTVKVRTGRGKHLYFVGECDGGTFKADGVDILTGAARMVVVPPSRHRNGESYRFVGWDKTTKLAHVPDCLKALKPEKNSPASPAASAIRAGGRNAKLTSIAGSLRRRDLSEKAIAGALEAINAVDCKPALDAAEVSRIAHSIMRYAADSEEAFANLDEVEPEEVQFLAYPYVVKGATTVLDGNMGQGKSSFTAALAAAVTTGKPPPFLNQIEQGGVLFLSAEDDAARVLKPRLLANGADVSLVRYQERVFTLDEVGLERLADEFSAYTPALVVIDPIIAYMDAATDGNKANDTMRFMVELDHLARRFDTSILIVRHLRKAKADNAMHQGIGSIAISARVRSGLILGPHPEDPGKRAVVHAKANYSEHGPAIIFELDGGTVGKPPRVRWHEPNGDITADDILSANVTGPGRPSKERDVAQDFLRAALCKGAKPAKQVERSAEARGITLATLRRAAEELKIEKTREGKKSMWRLS